MSKYASLQQYLMQLKLDMWQPTFKEIEAILGVSLPRSARVYPAWWGNHPKDGSQSSAWLKAGWRTSDLQLETERVVFRRVVTAQMQNALVRMRKPSPLQEAPPHSWDEQTPLSCKIEMQWIPAGRVITAPNGGLIFPVVPRNPGLYRFRIRLGNAESIYFGETTNLARRFQNYRTPGPTQPTNQRIHEILIQALDNGGEIGVAVVYFGAWIDFGAGRLVADLSQKATRCLLENAAITQGGGADIAMLNMAVAPTTGHPEKLLLGAIE